MDAANSRCDRKACICEAPDKGFVQLVRPRRVFRLFKRRTVPLRSDAAA
jgi:hypothetical protein